MSPNWPKGSWCEIFVSDGLGDSVTQFLGPRGALGPFGVRQRAGIVVVLMQCLEPPVVSVKAARSMLFKAWARAKFDSSLQKQDSCI